MSLLRCPPVNVVGPSILLTFLKVTSCGSSIANGMQVTWEVNDNVIRCDQLTKEGLVL